MEQLYPLPDQQLQTIMKKYENAQPIWVQEEPSNMGAWQYISSLAHNDQIGFDLSNLKYVARKSSASPATGFKKVHDQTQVSIVERAFNE